MFDFPLPQVTSDLSAYQVAAILTFTAAFLMVQDRRLIVAPLLLQYILIAMLVSPQLYRPVFVIRLILGIATAIIVYITALHMEQALAPFGDAAPPGIPALQEMNLVFRLLALGLASLLAFGLWSAYPLSAVPGPLALGGYWLLALGLVLALISVDPLHRGVGLLILVSGFEGVYLFLEQSLLVVGLLGMVDVLLALAVSYCSEAWLEALREEVPAG